LNSTTAAVQEGLEIDEDETVDMATEDIEELTDLVTYRLVGCGILISESHQVVTKAGLTHLKISCQRRK
jgi:hypothetical protein